MHYIQGTLFKLRWPTKAEMQKLVKFFAIKHYALIEGAEHKTVSRLCDKFGAVMDKMVAKYPELDLDHNRPFLLELNQQAKEWWKSRPFRGPGVDW